ncbi:hypothetical protein [Clostridium botulinum]|uniref:hypothetical protein n=1 Tax=Clostridium botulinum TaxID=1491 RepID=UPI00077451F1|nr:hypothetical protein [Clostridium botulinum]AUN04849.1 hypothetical protein RSJ19_18870 [Clostridium botulinum]MBN3396907.1 hypothetical protein [Clostridium botulinum]MBN3412308.1 hypothetical protein [Clostridium botulinum]
MGTSKGYLPPKGFLWKDTKTAITNMAKNNFDSESISKAMNKYVRARRNTSGDSSRQQYNKQMATSGAKALNFVNLYNTFGLNDTLNKLDLSNLIGKSNEDIYVGLVDYFAPNSDTFENSIVRDCMAEIFDDFNIFDEENAESKISDKEFLQGFFIKYIQKSFISNFFEKIQGLCKNIEETNRAINEVKKYIRVTLETEFTLEELIKIDWTSSQGERFVSSKCDEAFDIFKILR